MKKLLTFTMAAFFGLHGFSQNNPFFEEWNTPFGVPPFDQIRVEHFLPAYEAGIAEEAAQIWAIIRNPEPPTFENTIVALDQSGPLLRRTIPVFSGLMSVANTPEKRALSRQLSPMLTAHRNSINMNPYLFQRVRAVYEQRDQLDLNIEQRRLLENTYRRFIRSGALLSTEDQARLRHINTQLSLLQLQFSQNVVADRGAFTLRVTDRRRLGGLTPAQLTEARARAERAGYPNEWHFTLDNPSVMPFLQNASDRELRKEIFHAFKNRNNNDNEYDNKEIIRQLLAYRLEAANLLGYETFAHMATAPRMVQNPETVMNFISSVWEPALITARRELENIEAEMRRARVPGPAVGADWFYFQNRSRQRRLNINEEEVRQFFVMENVLQGIFYVCNRLWGITFEQLHDMPLPHEEFTVWKVTDSDGETVLGIVYLDMHPRPGTKNGGAWAGSYRAVSWDENGNRIPPIITLVHNFTRPVGNRPALLTADEVTTFFHEWGHGLNHLFNTTRYFGTGRMTLDFSEFPAQVMEHWAFQPEVLRQYARHYRTNRLIPNALVQRIQQNEMYGQGFRTIEFFTSAWIDMEAHLLTEIPADFNIVEFEYAVKERHNWIEQIPARHRPTHFTHIFSGQYSAGYYVYRFAEQFDSDAFEAFLETGNIFDPELARKLRFEIFARGDIEDAGTLYRNFRGRDPDVNALLRNRGLGQ
ncbi:MAG: M3 family metallopeptidase [Bacteroidales bacterium]|nr:M3 family metallopeptidase [Bacteroidales bacterium]